MQDKSTTLEETQMTQQTTSLKEKLAALVQAVLVNGGAIEIGVDLPTGNVTMNGIAFTPREQMEMVAEFRNDPTMNALMAQVNNTQQARDIRRAVTFSGGDFKVDADLIKQTFGIDIPTGTEQVGDVKVTTEDAKDREIAQLREQLELTQAELAKKEEEENRLVYPRDFFNAFEEPCVPVDELTDEEIQNILDSLVDTEVSVGNYIAVSTGDTIVIKIHDAGAGYGYIISSDYYQATHNK